MGPDLTQGGRAGDVAFGTLTTITESPRRFGLIYVGSDDGLVHRSDNGGESWTRLSGFPSNLWVSRLEAGHADTDVVYLSLNGYRDDDFASYLYRSTDRGESWTAIGSDLPAEPVNVIKEDPYNPALLYVGTDHGLYVSMDTGATFTAMTELPAVAVHDVVVQEQEKDLIVGTHGRSLYRADVELLQQLAGNDSPELTLLPIEDQRYSSRYGSASWTDDDTSPEVQLRVYSPGADAGADLTVKSEAGTEVLSKSVGLTSGINTIRYDLSFDEGRANQLEEELNANRKEDQQPVRIKPADNGMYYLRAGSYTIELTANGQTVSQELTVK
jgi:hypothetical protein